MAGMLECAVQNVNHNCSVQYWQSEVDLWKERYKTTRADLDEFTVSSQELEHELEEELNLCKQQNRRLKSDVQTLTEENRSLKESDQRTAKRIAAMEDEIKTCDAQKQSFLQYRRELEQKNDDMETSYRNLTASLSDHTKRIEELMEIKALLENELELTRGHREIEQRLRDELKDLREEVAVRRKSDDGVPCSACRDDQRSRRRTLNVEEIQLSSDNEISQITRLQALAMGNFNESHQKLIMKGSADQTPATPNHLKSTSQVPNKKDSIMQTLMRKITTLETQLLTVQHPSVVRKTVNGGDVTSFL